MTMDLHPESFERIIDNLHDGLYFVDPQRRITFWNEGAERITGYSEDEVLGKKCSDNILNHMDGDGNLLCLGMCPLAATIQDQQGRSAEVFLHHKNGQRIPVLVRTSPLTDQDGEVIGGIEIFTDISNYAANQQRIDELERLALLDDLTQMPNRTYLERELKARFEEHQRYGVPFGVLFLDIDHFKTFNDSYGHDLGDRVLQFTASTMTGSSRPFDIYGRWGGEEFLGLIRNVQSPELELIGERLRKLIQESYLEHEGEEFRVTVSIGATVVSEEDQNPKDVVNRADDLLYQSKSAGRNRLTAA
jgi:diguanylate cyclase (GGDEF)-like protein/PAS domain S-box-containing protein